MSTYRNVTNFFADSTSFSGSARVTSQTCASPMRTRPPNLPNLFIIIPFNSAMSYWGGLCKDQLTFPQLLAPKESVSISYLGSVSSAGHLSLTC